MKDNFDLQLYNMLPSFYRNEDAKIRPNPEPLRRFLKILHEGGFKQVIHEIDSHQNLLDIDVVDSKHLMSLVQTLGLDFPYNMSDKERRKYLKIIPAIYKSKGTADSFNYLAREIFSTKTNINTRAEVYEEGMTPEEWRRVFIDIEVDGALPDLQRKEENFRKFVELVRPVNRILVINLILTYYAEYKFAERVRDPYFFDTIKYIHGVDNFIKTMLDISFDIATKDDGIDLFEFSEVVDYYISHKLKELIHESNYNTTAKSKDYYFVEGLTLKTEYDGRTQSTLESSMNTKFILTRPPSKLVTSQKLTTDFYITNYNPVSLNLNY